jgi:hypothetical protein
VLHAARAAFAAGAEEADQTALVRDLFGNPFRATRTVERSWLRWEGGRVAEMARTIYDQHRFADLPILGDALEDAGCEDAEILKHCRSGSPVHHARGCWLVDLLRAKAKK